MKLIFSHPTGNANVRAALNGLNEAKAIYSFHTTVACFPKSPLAYLANNFSLFSEFRRREYSGKLRHITKLHPWKEIGRLVALKAKFSTLTKHEKGIFCIDAVYRDLDKRVANSIHRSQAKIGAVYAYEDGAVQSFRVAKEAGINCLYDLPIGHWQAARRWLEKEQEIWPQWASTLTGFKDSEQKLAWKDEELRLADRIFVASSFTAKTLDDFPATLAPVEVIPYGFPPVVDQREYSDNVKKKPLKLLFVGGLSQRKGIANLFAAVEGLKSYINLTIIGRKVNNDCCALDAALVKHQWIPSLPHSEILRQMQMHDVLVFPSLFEGFGLVITEAMSQGTPVITTDRTAGPDFIRHGENGWLVEPGSTQSLRQCIENLIHKPEQIIYAGKAAMETARQRPWDLYERELTNSIVNKKLKKSL